MKHSIEAPKLTPAEAKEKSGTFEGTLKIQVRLVNKVTGEIKEQEVFFGGIPLMTDKATFIVNGIERVVVSQLVRSPGVFFSPNPAVPHFFAAKIIPKRGAWLELETDKRGIIAVKIDRKRKIPITALIRAFTGWEDDRILKEFADVDTAEGKLPFHRDDARKRSRGDRRRSGTINLLQNPPSAISRLRTTRKRSSSNYFSIIAATTWDPVGRYKLNKRFKLKTPADKEHRVFQIDDLILIIKTSH